MKNSLSFLTAIVSNGYQGDMKKNHQIQAVCRFLFFYLTMQMAIIQQAVAVGSLADPMSFGSLLPFLTTVYRGTPETKNPLPDLDLTPQSVQPPKIIRDNSDAFDPLASVVAPQYHQIKSQLTFQDSIGLKLDEEESLVLAPSEFPAVAKVSDMADENWPQLIAAESVGSDTSGIRSVFKWADQWRLNAFPDDPLLRFLAFIHGAAFCVQDNNGQLSYIIQRNGKLLSVSRFEAYLQFSLYSQSFLESLYPEIFGPSLPAGGGWHEWNRYVRKQPFHPYKRSENANNSSGFQRPLSQYGNNESSTRSETRAHHSEPDSEQARESGTTSTETDGRQEHINQQKVEAIYDYEPPENADEEPTALYAIAFLNESQQYLYCAVCTLLITGKAKACKSNTPHSVCIGCFESIVKEEAWNIKQCITCRGEMQKGSINYRAAAELIMFQCPSGCNHSCPLAFMKNHIKEHHSPDTPDDRLESTSPGEGEQAIPPGSVLFYGVPVMLEHRDRIEGFLQTCRQINNPEHQQLAEAFTQVFQAFQSRSEQLAIAHTGQINEGAACHIHDSSHTFFNSIRHSVHSAYSQCIRSTGQQSAKCRFCNTRLCLNGSMMGVREHLSECSGIVPCPNSGDGCSFQHNPALVPMHLLKCRYNKVECRICRQQVAVSGKTMHRKNCHSSVLLDQDYALFDDRTVQKLIQLYGEHDKKGTIPVYKVPEEDTYYCKISKHFYESITQGGRERERQGIVFIGNNPDNSVDFIIEFFFDGRSGSLALMIFLPTEKLHKSKECRRMALPIIFNGKGEKLLNKSFVLTKDFSCGDCGCRVTKDTFTHSDPYPICLDNVIHKRLHSRGEVLHNDDFTECIYVQIKLTPFKR
ncbi:hypothetical protein [Endozoicomonas sp. 4G]|uniref:hypothetical protein n=1 Tax=Endozoicomonas sp. 4G TaxID=2872754 RepID=UPI002078D443|nr:hypothetical protein [Endozoicomonas sp. 4G]